MTSAPTLPGVVDAKGHWDGVYLGAFAGFGTGYDYDEKGPIDATTSFDGLLLGGAAGVDMTIGNGIVVGVVGDLAASTLTARSPSFDPDVQRVDWVGSLRGRVGIDAGSFMPYLTAGLAATGAELVNLTGSQYDYETSIGWTAGAGVEIAMSDSLSLDVLYRYSDYGIHEYDFTDPFPSYTDGGFSTQQVTVGLNWRF